jgi:hypothetical protein
MSSVPQTPRERELEARLAEAQQREQALMEKIEKLSDTVAALTPRSSSPAAFSGLRPGIPTGAPSGATPRAGSRPVSPRPSRPLSPGRGGAAAVGLPTPRPPSPGRSVAFGSTSRASVTPRKNAIGQPAFFHASMRGGPLSEPLPQRGPTPLTAIKGPSLLTREKHGAKKSEWERFKTVGGEEGGNFFEDDNPFNDPFKYVPYKGLVYPPSDYIGPDDARENDDLSSLKPNKLSLEFVYGYTSRRVRANLFYNKEGKIVYHSAALGIVYDKEASG